MVNFCKSVPPFPPILTVWIRIRIQNTGTDKKNQCCGSGANGTKIILGPGAGAGAENKF